MADNYLTLGWQVNANQDPKYWINAAHPKPGSQKESDLARISSDSVAAHTAIIAQSGSGKSFFLGRLVEELVLNTKARCLIFDPNADFRRIRQIESKIWEDVQYSSSRQSPLPHEASKDEFEKQWREITVRVRTGSVFEKKRGYEQFRFWWPSLLVEFLSGELEPIMRSELYHCHAFVNAIASFVKLKFLVNEPQIDLIDAAEDLFEKAKDGDGSLKYALDERFELEELKAQIEEKADLLAQALDFLGVDQLSPSAPVSHRQTLLHSIIDQSTKSALRAAKYTSRDVGQYYFAKAREYQDDGLLQTVDEAQNSKRRPLNRIDVVDLPTLKGKDARLLAINTVLTSEWERARRDWSLALEHDAASDVRVPTFIVVDEAHNLMACETTGQAETALREQFRTIVAEGRKYGLFLILVSQRPDKLDRQIVSECENKVIMKLGSASVLQLTKEILGLDDVPQQQLAKALKLKKGRALMVGRWSPEIRVVYGAARRTVEGGRNLNDKYWAVPDTSTKSKTTGTKADENRKA
jgi:DNA helicase HerA-like ATPase